VNILIIGNLGSIGRRYSAILDHLGVEWSGFDPISGDTELATSLKNARGAIIASPTELHETQALQCTRRYVPFLCEKPISTDLEIARGMASLPGFVVNNYQFCLGRTPKGIEYNYYRTGKDGKHWDLCQLIYLDKGVKISTDSPVWTLTENGRLIPYRELEISYVNMIRCWLKSLGWNGLSEYGEEWLWTMRDGFRMTLAVQERINEDADRHTS